MYKIDYKRINMAENGTTKKKRIFYFDALRALAIICVVMVHTVTINKYLIYNAYVGPTLSWIVSQIIYNPVRVGVLLFLMLSGALSLGREWEIKPFLSKRIPRIVYPFAFWNIIFIIIFIILSFVGISHVVDAFDIGYLLNFAKGAFMGEVYGFNANWFFWMILGTYLIMPIFNRWLLHSDLKEAEYFLVFWLITCVFSFTLNMEFPIKLTYFVSPIGLVVCGYYLRYTERKFLNNPYLALVVLIIVSAISTYIGYLRSDPTNISCFNRYSIFNTLIAISLFIIFKNFSKFNLKVKFNAFRKLLSSLAKYSYGIYLVHYPLIFMSGYVLPKASMPYGLLIVVSICIGLFGSMAILAILNRVPYVNGIIGAK